MEEFVSRVGRVSRNLACPPKGPGGVQVQERWQIAANHRLRLSKLYVVLCSGSSPPDGDGGGKDGLYDGSVEEHHHRFGQFLSSSAATGIRSSAGLYFFVDVHPPLEVMSDDDAQEAEGLH